ncbi:MAG: ATPases with chaperone activity, ATP-binding subunit, ATP-dependent Clp protease ATP-binding subunit ClpC [Candidatus Peregrinibacteria bacterium GW2011_GWF2_33_10]|nr:MAG: ATPases with chaperone activity, ATP-binding subunit, ATP-dependent Clp protease ATP-binding subunit ClpC [Candidatus Peregrinibacteria bacterium GW2011_GWF2_33_10]OGJ44288.1 MAG: hypothetical protein A2272_05515 [Candidatus Peregrinibacteria bacterium RIFOXYA12_FULL_33_12]OGJ44663.1 MAG: hypothetical protein A2263_00955 [Candidatus Peregrinibacteria bacterium RIFOXYA2_FULL_33_21]OGJ50397.1 MAG: hypothetical protein A2307_06015 [Candidatus Peregrinibacteria bacterium RIFOXYB2_FULL_33_20]
MDEQFNNRFNKFTKEAKAALIHAQEKAKEINSSYVGTEHILMGILNQNNSLGAAIIKEFGVSRENVELVLKTVGRISGAMATPQQQGGGLSGFAKKVIEEAVKCAHDYGHSFVGTEHLLFAIVNQQNTAATVILENMKIRIQDVKNRIIEIFNEMRNAQQNQISNMPNPMMNPLEFFLNGLHGVLIGKMPDQYYKDAENPPVDPNGQPVKKKSKTPALDYFTTDLVKQCRDGKIGPIIGREKDIERVITILQRKTKNNPVLIGEPGVGKTAVIEGLAQKIMKEEIPEKMFNKRVLSLTMAAVVAGTKYRGEFEERIKQIIDEAASQSDVILFVDEIHTLIGAGSAEGSLDAANILKPALSRGKIQLIGATTINEHRKYIEKDAALERRFQQVVVEESTEDETLQIMFGIREGFENHHNLRIDDAAIKAAVKLSKRYVNDRFLPDKAIDVLDEAAAFKSIFIKPSNEKVKILQQKLTKTIQEKESAVSSQDYEKAALLRTEELKIIDEINESKKIQIPRNERQNITEEDIAKVISKITGIPMTKLIESEIKKLQTLEDTIKKHIIGQDEAITAIAQAIRRSRTGISNPNRPIASFIFLGPTGVGKTEVVKTLAREIYNDEDALIKIDMSEFMERHNASRLTGTTAGYVGYEEGGQLTESVRRKPYSIILFDEAEKAHKDVLNMLLQILEDGYLTDGKGRKVDFRNTIIILTSNIGARSLTEKAASIGFKIPKDELIRAEEAFEEKKKQVLEDLKNELRPEFINRVDKIIVFKPLTHDMIKDIVKLNLNKLQDRLKERNLSLDISNDALDYLAELSYDPDFGARPVRRKLEELVENQLTDGLLERKFLDNDKINISKNNNAIVLIKKKVRTTKSEKK